MGVFCQIVIQLVIISLQYIAGGSILHAILPDIFDFHTGMIVSAITFIGITFIGGMWSASLSNVLNIILIYVGILAATIIQFKKIGSMDHLAAALPANVPWFSFIDGVGPVTITSWVVTLITVNLSLQVFCRFLWALRTLQLLEGLRLGRHSDAAGRRSGCLPWFGC